MPDRHQTPAEQQRHQEVIERLDKIIELLKSIDHWLALKD